MADPDRIREAYRHCEVLVRTYDKDRYLAALFAPAERRQYLFSLYAFDFELARVKSAAKEPMAGLVRLQWWLEAVNGLRAQEAASSPVMIALQDASQQTVVSLAPLAAVVEARQAEFEGTTTSGGASAIFLMAARFLGGERETVSVAAEQAGRAFSGVNTREAYEAFRTKVADLPDAVLPAFLPVALVPLRSKWPDAPQWRRQLVLLRTAWFGFPKS